LSSWCLCARADLRRARSRDLQGKSTNTQAFRQHLPERVGRARGFRAGRDSGRGTRCSPPSCTVTHGRPQAPRPSLAVSTRCFMLGSTAASRTVLRPEGLPETTLERIADAAGVSRATIYRRGVSRDQLIDALTARAADEFRRALWPARPAPTPPGNGFDWHWRRSVPSPTSTWTCLPACSWPTARSSTAPAWTP
jgi:hypothetical protein